MKWLLGRRRVARRALAVAIGAALLASACGTPPSPARKEVVVWKRLGEWSGHGNAQTESFLGLTGALRIGWRTKNEAPGRAGTLRLILQSAVSGRPLQEAVNQNGPGEGMAYVAEDPRIFYILVESADVDWSFTVEEAAFSSQAEKPKARH